MKRRLALAVAFGAGVAAVGVAGLWLMSRNANRPRPWNPTAITATFGCIVTEGTEKKLVFYYILQNNTDHDFRLNSEAEVLLAGKLGQQQSLTGETPKEFLAGEFPLFLPARHRVRLGIHLGYTYQGSASLSAGATKADRERDRGLLVAYVRDELSNLDGFVLFHEATRYQIDLPKGWGERRE